MAQTSSRGVAKQTAKELAVGLDARKRLLDFYLERDRQDAERCEQGEQRGRGGVYALGISRLESNADVYESYQVLKAAGIELDSQTESYIRGLSRDWRFVCRIDAEGRVWTASVRQKNTSAW